MEKEAILALEDGTILHGKGFGAETEATGEVVFNTSMVGYPELLTDPSYYEQIVVMTYPIIGSYGVPSYSITDEFGVPLHFESDSIKVKGYAVHTLSEPSHWSSKKSLNEWLSEGKIPGIYGIDTRALTQKIRTKGTMLGKLIIDREIRFYDPNKDNLVEKVSTKKVYDQTPGVVWLPTSGKEMRKRQKTVLLFDCGAKGNIAKCLLKRGVRVVTVPWDFDPFEDKSRRVTRAEGVPSSARRNPQAEPRTFSRTSDGTSERQDPEQRTPSKSSIMSSKSMRASREALLLPPKQPVILWHMLPPNSLLAKI